LKIFGVKFFNILDKIISKIKLFSGKILLVINIDQPGEPVYW